MLLFVSDRVNEFRTAPRLVDRPNSQKKYPRRLYHELLAQTEYKVHNTTHDTSLLCVPGVDVSRTTDNKRVVEVETTDDT